jgi:hypothetical protein
VIDLEMIEFEYGCDAMVGFSRIYMPGNAARLYLCLVCYLDIAMKILWALQL